MTDPIRLCLDGRMTPEIAVARLLLAGETPRGIASRVQGARRPGEMWRRLSQIAEARPAELARLRGMLDAAEVDHAGPSTPAAIAASFDRAVAVSPEASVALYSLGNPEALAAATEEIVAWLDREGLLGLSRDVLDLGCGIGRIAAALAGRVRSVLGLDVSAGMIAEARRRCADLPNLRFEQTEGRDLGSLADGSVDLALAVDSFPYLLQAGLAERHVAEAARILRRSGTFAIFNFSYRGDPAADRHDAQAWAERHRFRLRPAGVTPFTHWDGTAYVLTAQPAAGNQPTAN